MKQASREVLETTPLHDPAPQDFAGPVPTRVPAVPRTAVIWNRQGTGTYLWDAPAGRIVGRLENGHVVFLLENWQAAGGVPFGEVLWAEAQVWADMRHVHRVVLPASGFRTVAGLGAGLYTAPGGARLSWLPPGTPFLPSAAAGPDGWLPVKLLVGGEAGWIPSAALQP